MKTCLSMSKIVTLTTIVLLLSGCLGYQIGGTTPDHIKTVALAPIINRTTEPAIEQPLTHAMRSFIQLDGRLTLTDTTQADAILEITLTRHQSQPIAYRSNQRDVAPRFYRQTLTATARLRNTQTGELISESTNHGESLFEFTSDLSTSKRNTYADAADELARLLFSDLIETWP